MKETVDALSPLARELLQEAGRSHRPPLGAKAQGLARFPAALSAPSAAALEAESGLLRASSPTVGSSALLVGAGGVVAAGTAVVLALLGGPREPPPAPAPMDRWTLTEKTPALERERAAEAEAKPNVGAASGEEGGPEPTIPDPVVEFSSPVPRDEPPPRRRKPRGRGRPAAPERSAAAAHKERAQVSPATTSGPAHRDDAPAASRATVRLTSSLAEEAALMSQARSALRDGDVHRALEAIEEHAHRFPSGALLEERLAAHALALCQLNRLAEARNVRFKLNELNGRSPYLPRIDAACRSGR